MKILLLDDNLMSSLQIERVLRRAGNEVVTNSKVPEKGEFERVVFNLGSRSLKALELLLLVKERFPDANLWGFCGHKEVEIWRAARAAGVEKIVTNEAAMSGEL